MVNVGCWGLWGVGLEALWLMWGVGVYGVLDWRLYG